MDLLFSKNANEATGKSMLEKIQQLLKAILSLGNNPVLPTEIQKQLESVKGELSHIKDELKTPLTQDMIRHLDDMEQAAKNPHFQPTALKDIAEKAQNSLPRKA